MIAVNALLMSRRQGAVHTKSGILIRKRAMVAVLLGLLFFVLVSSGCSEKEEKRHTSKITIGIGRDLYFGPASATFLHGSLNVWEGLTSLDDRLETCPQLAETWDMKKNGRLWTFHLRKGVYFHDGETLNSKVIVKNIERMRKNTRFDVFGTFGNVKSVIPLDRFTVCFSLYLPDPVFPARLSYFGSPIFSSGSFNSKGDVVRPIGTGPYIFKEYIKGKSITLQRNERYYIAVPRLQEIVFEYFPDPYTRSFALKAGRIDAVVDIGGLLPSQVALLCKDRNIRIFTREVATTHYLLFNTAKLPFSSRDLREEVSLSIDRDKIVQTIYERYARTAQEFLTPLAQAWIPDAHSFFEDRTMTKKPAETHTPFSGKIIFAVNAGLAKRWPYKPLSEVIQACLMDLGLNVEIRILETGAWKEALKKGDFDISMSPNTLMTGDPDFFFSLWIHSSGRLNMERGILYKNPVADSLIEKARTETDKPKRRAMYDELQRIIMYDLPLTPLFHDVAIYACRKEVKDLRLDAFFKPSLHKARTADR